MYNYKCNLFHKMFKSKEYQLFYEKYRRKYGKNLVVLMHVGTTKFLLMHVGTFYEIHATNK